MTIAMGIGVLGLFETRDDLKKNPAEERRNRFRKSD